jgi:hypothetical protein
MQATLDVLFREDAAKGGIVGSLRTFDEASDTRGDTRICMIYMWCKLSLCQGSVSV